MCERANIPRARERWALDRQARVRAALIEAGGGLTLRALVEMDCVGGDVAAGPAAEPVADGAMHVEHVNPFWELARHELSAIQADKPKTNIS